MDFEFFYEIIFILFWVMCSRQFRMLVSFFSSVWYIGIISNIWLLNITFV